MTLATIVRVLEALAALAAAARIGYDVGWKSALHYAERALERERARGDRFLEQLLALRREGFTPQKAGAVIAPPDPEANAQRRAADEWIANYVADATAHGATREQALEAARQLRAELDQEHIPLES